MCLIVDYYCICGVVARTEQVQWSAALARPLPTRFEETHQTRQIAMILPRDEWNARQGVCTQNSCPQNSTSTGTVNLAKCPGCSTLCYEIASLPDGLLAEGLELQFQSELKAITTVVDSDKSNSDCDLETELEMELEEQLTELELADFEDFEVDVNKAEFLPRNLWPTYDCTLEFCPFNKESMAQAGEKLSSIVEEMKRETESSIQWNKDDDAQILDLASHGADDELIAAVVNREVSDVHERLTCLRVLSELLK